MLRTRVIPCLLLKGKGLVKTEKFKDPTYVGDPINAVKIFNEKEVDELLFLDISATPEGRGPNFELIKQIASEAFMPFSYGGGITKMEEIDELFKLGVEKVVLNTSAFSNPQLITEASEKYGNQSIVVCIDVKKKLFGGHSVFTKCGTEQVNGRMLDLIDNVVKAGAGEIILNSIDKEGTQSGFDLNLLKTVTSEIRVPVIACGGARDIEDLASAVKDGGADAVSAGSMFVFYGKHRAVLITYPKYEELLERLS